ncbi:hypothetical protein EG835_03035, partial [bacterium]|nr:hypothetical protein [bacterium]
MTAAPKKKTDTKAEETTVKTAPELELSAVKTLVKMGKAKGNLTDEEIQGALSDIDLNEEQFENIYSFFSKNGIDIAEEHSPAGDLEDDIPHEEADADVVVDADVPSDDVIAAVVEKPPAKAAAKKRPRRKTDTVASAPLTSDPVRMYLKEIGKVP